MPAKEKTKAKPKKPNATNAPTAKAKKPKSVVEFARNIPVKTRCMLWGLAGGHCEFAGCNEPLLEHSVTSMQVSLAEVAHVVAFSDYGARGKRNRPPNVHSLDNLMLLCASCHKLVDDKPDDFTREMLRVCKRVHEARVRHLTSLAPDMGTTVVQLKALIAGRTVDIPVSHVYEAVSPRWPTSRQGHVIDLTAINVEDDAGTKAAADKIDAEVTNLYRPGMDADKARHISLFALAPIPLLMHLGSRLTDKIALDFFQRHRDPGTTPWKWRNDKTPVEYIVKGPQAGTANDKVALVVSLSGPVARQSLPPAIDASFHIYEITVDGFTPNPDFLRSRDDLERFRQRYRLLLAEIAQAHGQVAELHVFPAVPAPVAIVLGHDLLPKVHPDLLAYDFDKVAGGFTLKLRITKK
jgi:5-methylcytosine-specific restriction endonuclease McrA